MSNELPRTAAAVAFRIRHVQGGIFCEMFDGEGKAMGIAGKGRPFVYPSEAQARQWGIEQGWKELA